jgi:sirohydrochlorin ferrochelatase
VTTVVLLAHGSPDPRSGAAVRAAAAEVGARLPGRHVVAAFLDHDAPRLADVVHRRPPAPGDPDATTTPSAVAGSPANAIPTTQDDAGTAEPADRPDQATDGTASGASRTVAPEVVVLPLLLASAYHARVDVPAAVDELEADARLLPPLGHPAEVLDAVLEDAGAPVVVVAAGTRVDEERAAFVEAVAASSARTGITAYAAFATGPGPKVADVLVPGATVVPWLLAPGRLLDAVQAESWGHQVHGDGHGLLARPDLLATIAARLTNPASFD